MHSSHLNTTLHYKEIKKKNRHLEFSLSLICLEEEIDVSVDVASFGLINLLDLKTQLNSVVTC